MLLPCLCDSGSLLANFEEVFIQFICLSIGQLRQHLGTGLPRLCSSSAFGCYTEQVIVQFIDLHMLLANWILTCLASAALETLVFPCCCNFSALAVEFKQATVSVHEQLFAQLFFCLCCSLT